MTFRYYLASIYDQLCSPINHPYKPPPFFTCGVPKTSLSLLETVKNTPILILPTSQ